MKDMFPVSEPLLCLCLTEMHGKFLVAGMKRGHVFIYNRSKGTKKIVQGLTKKDSDILAAVNLERLDSKYFLI